MVAILAGGAASPPDAPGWVHGVAATGVVVTGTDATGVDAIGTEIGVITVTIMSFSSVTSVFPAGGAGDIQDITAMGIRTATTGTVMAIRTAMDMAIPAMDTAITGTGTVMDMATGMVANTAPLPGRE